MNLPRFEFNVTTGARVQIEQIAYRNSNGDVIVLDSASPPPDGFFPFDPADDVEQSKE